MELCPLTNEELKARLNQEERFAQVSPAGSKSHEHYKLATAILRELLARRKEDSVIRFNDPELLALERSLAYEAASGVIDGCCASKRVNGSAIDEWWSNIDDVAEVAGIAEEIADAVRYLEARGLIERHPDHPNWVQVRDEDEPELEPLMLTPSQVVDIVEAFQSDEKTEAEDVENAEAAAIFGTPLLETVFAPADEAAR
jgi:hypothetical protein